MLNFGVMKAGLGLKAYRFRGRNFNRAKRGDFKQSMELVFEVEILFFGRQLTPTERVEE